MDQFLFTQKYRMAMKLMLHRRFVENGYTIGSLYVNGTYFCDTLEDKDRALTRDTALNEIRKIKIPGKTAIPTGIYKVVVNPSPTKKRVLPRLLDVPGFGGILIHRGNTKRDTAGCILIGENKSKGKVVYSTEYERRLVEILAEAQERGEEITIEINRESIAETRGHTALQITGRNPKSPDRVGK
jgi:hypothetical protein